MAWAHQKLYIFDGPAWKNLWCQGELVNLKWSGPGQTDCNSQNYLPFSDIFGICAKYLSPNLRLTNFDKPLMFAVKLGKLVWILADAYWLSGPFCSQAWCIIIRSSPGCLCPVRWRGLSLEKNGLLSLKLGIIANLFFSYHSLFKRKHKAAGGSISLLPGITWWLQNN